MSAPQAVPAPFPCAGVYSPDQCKPRQLWQPDEAEQLIAVETLMKGPIPEDVREVLRGFHTILEQRNAS